METLILRGRPDQRNECDQWTVERDAENGQEFVVQEHVRLDALTSGKPHLRLVRRMTVPEFLSTDQPPARNAPIAGVTRCTGHGIVRPWEAAFSCPSLT
ncbi:MAG: hypothetical protein ABSE50_10390 [Xanthobacteraceae bacterium]|jgi:hypothetical protein